LPPADLSRPVETVAPEGAAVVVIPTATGQAIGSQPFEVSVPSITFGAQQTTTTRPLWMRLGAIAVLVSILVVIAFLAAAIIRGLRTNP
jgi:hypothetical protein